MVRSTPPRGLHYQKIQRSASPLEPRVRESIRSEDGSEKLGEERYVLKDCWLYSDAKLQGEILDEIFQSLREIDEREKTHPAENAAPYFMDIKHDWRVEFSEGQDTGFSVPPDAVRTLFTKTRQPISRTKTLGTQRHTALTSGPHEPDHKIQAPTFQFYTRFHARTVFKEVCTSIHDIENYRTLLRALTDIVKGEVELILLRLYFVGLIEDFTSARVHAHGWATVTLVAEIAFGILPAKKANFRTLSMPGASVN
ncbi:hypothetical protein C0995_003595 [Termitomyces sp. Mi166|nr:hypothetical protein C0995_003595 [Termitomyces sp. Mi166\